MSEYKQNCGHLGKIGTDPNHKFNLIIGVMSLSRNISEKETTQ